MGTSISCTGTRRSTIFSTSSNFSTNCGTGASRTGTPRTGSTSCSTKCRWTRSCGPDTDANRSGLEPPAAGTSSTSMAKYWVPAAWGGGAPGTWPCTTPRTPSPALAVFCPLEEWCVNVARACCDRLPPVAARSRRRLRRCCCSSGPGFCQLVVQSLKGDEKKKKECCTLVAV